MRQRKNSHALYYALSLILGLDSGLPQWFFFFFSQIFDKTRYDLCLTLLFLRVASIFGAHCALPHYYAPALSPPTLIPSLLPYTHTERVMIGRGRELKHETGTGSVFAHLFVFLEKKNSRLEKRRQRGHYHPPTISSPLLSTYLPTLLLPSLLPTCLPRLPPYYFLQSDRLFGVAACLISSLSVLVVEATYLLTSLSLSLSKAA